MKWKVKEKEKCGKCGIRMRKCRIIIGCKECKACFHHKCIEREKNMEDSIREGRWRCEGCEQGKKGEYNEEEEDRGDRIEDSGEKLETINHRNLKVIHWNADGISNKKEELGERMKTWKADIILIQETKLRPKQRTPQFKGFTTVRKDHKYIRKDEDRKGGGLLTLIKEDIPYRRIQGWRGKVTEGLVVYINTDSKNKMKITNVYRPPINRKEGIDERVQERIGGWITGGKNHLIAGDFNLHHEKWSKRKKRDQEADRLVEWCNSNEFKILNDGSCTHIDVSGRGEGASDISIVNKEIAGRCRWEILEEMGSGHKPILIKMKCHREGIRERPRTSWAWKKADWNKFQEIIEEKMQRTLEGSLREKIEKFNEVVLTAAEECIPKKKINQRNRPFWDEGLTELKKKQR